VTPEQLARARYELFSSGHATREQFDEVFADDAVIDDDFFNTHRKGRDAMWEAISRRQQTAGRMFTIECLEWYGDESGGVMLWRSLMPRESAANIGLGDPGRDVELLGVEVFTFRDGKIASTRAFYEESAFLSQFGIDVPQPGTFDRAASAIVSTRSGGGA
jgi:ketosteroid isomerase-like protein